MIGGAQYIRADGGRAEISLSVTDEYQGRGIGSILMGHTAQEAAATRHHHVRRRRAAREPRHDQRLPGERIHGLDPGEAPGLIEVEFPIRLTEEAVDHFEHRETEAAVNAMRTFLEPAIGRRRRRVARRLVRSAASCSTTC